MVIALLTLADTQGIGWPGQGWQIERQGVHCCSVPYLRQTHETTSARLAPWFFDGFTGKQQWWSQTTWPWSSLDCDSPSGLLNLLNSSPISVPNVQSNFSTAPTRRPHWRRCCSTFIVDVWFVRCLWTVLNIAGVPVHLLAQIWNLSDFDKDNNLSEPEFAVAMHLIYAVLGGQELPATLPQALIQSVAGVCLFFPTF